MAGTTASDTTILDVNQALYDALSGYIDVNPDTGVSIIFDLPAADSPPTEPTLSVFLYEIHEDLQMRTAQMRVPTYHADTRTSTIAPGWVNVCCNYIITYWDIAQTATSSPGSPGGAPDNASIKVMNQVVNALINNRQLADMPGAYTRMIPPKDELNTLGNFWQALGNKPRLSLSLSVTVPVFLTDDSDTAPAVQSTEVDMSQQQTGRS
ncbi:DUF4255 domain-containing protein [Paraburkholderia sp. SARCC-3016]|jgi:hypothetical protein|uniref:DUF4255 domain-containing protein n=1 Tax=Paraburkholderia sp. SARCC-3016 TaxID=3058611 RepID=UPI002806DE6B|nr:DUF4255 domain-containing protein [Paraburkholderia sp. SARCC-3016]MDQ7981310.1 DUF4255 domain-containing protein [Paraburkholderia sp. SARCC-3016]